MIRLRKGKLRWEKDDVRLMAKVIGAEAAVERAAPANPAIVKVAQRKGVELSAKAAAYLDKAAKDRIVASALKKHKDAPFYSPVEKRAFAHQRVALDYFKRMNLPAYLIADKTGVGKTLQSLLFAMEVAHSKRTLIITKNILKEQWAEAIRDFLGMHSITIVDGTIEEQNELAAEPYSFWVIGHWESLNHALYGYRKNPWGCIILDEAHYITNPKAYRSKAAYKLRAPYKIANTANPFSKNPAELNGILRFLYPQTYGSYWRFFHMHVLAQPAAFGGYEIEGARRPNLLKWEIAPFTLMRTKQQVFKSLPAISRERIGVRLTPRGLREYDRLRKAVFAELAALEGGNKYVPIINDLVRVTRLRQYLIDPAIIGGRESSIKYPAVFDLLDKIGAPTVIFTQYKQAALRLGAYLEKHDRYMRVKYIHGAVRKPDIPYIKKDFINGKIDALIVVAESGDTGLNLGGSGYVVALDLPWTIRGLEQYEGRVDRPQEGTGKLVPTTSYRVVVEGSYEIKQEQRLIRQDKTAKSVFTVADLKELFA